MNSLYEFLFRFREYFLLFCAIVTSFLLIFSNNSAEVKGFRSFVIETVSFVQEPLLEFERLGNLNEQNLRLKKKIAELSIEVQLREEAALENERLRKLLRFQNESSLALKPAKIINRGASSIVNSITINIGANQGTHKNQAVVVSEGVVGKTIGTSAQTSLIQLLGDVNFRLSVKTQRTRANGILIWNHDNICAMENVPKSLDVQVGDTVITSGYSDIFPEGLRVGEVIETTNDIPGYHKRIRLRTFVNFNELEEVFVVMRRSEGNG